MEASPAIQPELLGKPGEPFRGVFSTQTQSVIGFGSTKRKVKQNIFVFAEEQPDGSFKVRSLNKHFIPTGKSRTLGKEQLLSEYLPEPDLYMNKVVPMMRQVRETVDAADEHRAQAELMSAEFEYKNALRVDEEHIRATFGLGLTYLDRGELDNANLVCRRIITLEAAFGEEHKHLFNEFGIKMRKHKMYAQALRYYFKAYRLTRQDDHLLYNIARTYYEKGKLRLARKFLDMALAINPAFEEAGGLSRAIGKKAEQEERFPDLSVRKGFDA
jgi:tetratricopeptide (TPR) repeat protein